MSAVTDRREQTTTYIACFDADSGDVRWIRYVGAGIAGRREQQLRLHGGMQPSRDLAGRLQSSAALARGVDPLLPDESGRAGGDRGARRASTLWVASYPRQEPASARGRQRARFEPGGRFTTAGCSSRPAMPTRSSRLTPRAAACSGSRSELPTTSSCRTCWGLPRDGWSRRATAWCCSTSRPASCCTPGPTRGRRSTATAAGCWRAT